jgi:hypothetical protein
LSLKTPSTRMVWEIQSLCSQATKAARSTLYAPSRVVAVSHRAVSRLGRNFGRPQLVDLAQRRCIRQLSKERFLTQ